jgi:uncharacterized membrane protein
MSFVKNLRMLIQQSFLSLPLLLIGWSLFLGSMQGNIGLLVLFLGHLTVVPLTALFSNTLLEFLFKKLDGTRSVMDWIQVDNSDVCSLVPGKTDYSVPFLGVAPSLWMSHTVFFFAFLLSNAVTLYTMKPAENADSEKVERRKSQTLLSIILTSVLTVVLLLMRKFLVGCETWIGMAIAIALMGPLGYGWYRLARECSAKDSDIFGIVQSILPDEAQQPPPMTCVYTGAK